MSELLARIKASQAAAIEHKNEVLKKVEAQPPQQKLRGKKRNDKGEYWCRLSNHWVPEGKQSGSKDGNYCKACDAKRVEAYRQKRRADGNPLYSDTPEGRAERAEKARLRKEAKS